MHRSDDLVYNSFSFITETMSTGNRPNDIESMMQMAAMSVNTIGNTDSLDGLATTYEQARAMASDALSPLGIDYMDLASSAKNIKYSNLRDLNYTDPSFYTDFDSMEYTDQAYVFYYTRSIAGGGRNLLLQLRDVPGPV